MGERTGTTGEKSGPSHSPTSHRCSASGRKRHACGPAPSPAGRPYSCAAKGDGGKADVSPGLERAQGPAQLPPHAPRVPAGEHDNVALKDLIVVKVSADLCRDAFGVFFVILGATVDKLDSFHLEKVCNGR